MVSELPNARPFAFAVSLSSVAHVPDAESGANLMAVDPLGPIVVEGCCASKQQPSPGPTLIPVGVESRGQNSVRLNVDMPSAGLVVVLQSYDRGWSASVDGSRVDVRPADVLFQGVALPAGRHTVVLDYRPEGFVLGAVLSGISAAIIVLMTMPIGVRRRLSEPTLAVIRLLRRERNEPSTE